MRRKENRGKHTVVSIHQPVGSEGAAALVDLLVDEKERSEAERRALPEPVHAALAELQEQERKVLELRYRLQPPSTQPEEAQQLEPQPEARQLEPRPEVARQLHLTLYEVRKLEEQAKAKLRIILARKLGERRP